MASTVVAVGRAARRARRRPRFTRALRRTVCTSVAAEAVAAAAAATAGGTSARWPPSMGAGRRGGGILPPPTLVRRPRPREADRPSAPHTCRRRNARPASPSRRFTPPDPVGPPRRLPRHAPQGKAPTGRQSSAPAVAPLPDTGRVAAGRRRSRRSGRTAVAAARQRQRRVGGLRGRRSVFKRALRLRPVVGRPRGRRAAGDGAEATGAPRVARLLPSPPPTRGRARWSRTPFVHAQFSGRRRRRHAGGSGDTVSRPPTATPLAADRPGEGRRGHRRRRPRGAHPVGVGAATAVTAVVVAAPSQPPPQ